MVLFGIEADGCMATGVELIRKHFGTVLQTFSLEGLPIGLTILTFFLVDIFFERYRRYGDNNYREKITARKKIRKGATQTHVNTSSMSQTPQ